MKKKIKTKWIIKIGGEIRLLVKQGEMVKAGQVLAKVKNKIVESFNFADFFGKMNAEKLAELNDKFKNSWVNSGELLCLTGGIFPNKICFPMSGNFLEIDEFGNLKIERTDDQEKEIVSPVDSEVVKIEADKIVLEFEAQEFKGEGIVEGKKWGKGLIKIINEMKDLTSNVSGGVLFTDNLSKPFLLKAAVVGIMAIVINRPVLTEELVIDLPVLKVDEESWKEIMKHEGEERNILINSRFGRLLMVLE